MPDFGEFPYDQSLQLRIVEDGTQKQFNHIDMPYSAGRRQYDENGNWLDNSNDPIIFNDADGISHNVANPSDLWVGTRAMLGQCRWVTVII